MAELFTNPLFIREFIELSLLMNVLLSVLLCGALEFQFVLAVPGEVAGGAVLELGLFASSTVMGRTFEPRSMSPLQFLGALP